MSYPIVSPHLPNDEDVNALAEELGALGAGDTYMSRSGENVRVERVDERVLARALDHLRNASKDSDGIRRSRGALLERLRLAPLTYRLRSWQFAPDEQDQAFWSYTGAYKKGDRLVTAAGDVFIVVSVEHEASAADAGVLAVVRE